MKFTQILEQENKLLEALLEDKWSGNVKTSYHPPKGLFTKSAEDIAKQLKKDSSSMKQAVDRAVFYFNRNKKSDENTNKRKAVIAAIHKAYGKNEGEEHSGKIILEGNYLFFKMAQDHPKVVSATVTDVNTGISKTFSRAEYGDNFADTALEYMTSIGRDHCTFDFDFADGHSESGSMLVGGVTS